MSEVSISVDPLKAAPAENEAATAPPDTDNQRQKAKLSVESSQSNVRLKAK